MRLVGDKMGLFDSIAKFFNKGNRQEVKYAQMLDGSIPIYSSFGNDIYASDVVLQCLYVIIDEMTKLQPRHIRMKGFDVIQVENSDIQRVLDEPNPLMTFQDFMSVFMFNLLVYENSFVYIQYDGSTVVGLYPIRPNTATLCEDSVGKMFWKMNFNSGYEATIPYDLIIHKKNHFGANPLLGGDMFGQPNTKPLLETLKLNDALLKGVQKAMNSSFSLNGVVKYNTMMDDGSMEKKIKEFEEKIRKSESGILGVDNKADIIQFKRDLKLVDEATLKFIDDKILRNFKTPIEIVRGNYTAEQYESWYQVCLEPYIIGISQTFTKYLFTKHEKDGFKNKVKLYPKELLFMNTNQTLAMVNLLGQTGTLYENEKRVAFGYAPLPELNGVRLQSLNWVNVEYAKEYQTNQAKQKEEPKEEKEVEETTEEGETDD